jgi:hypothetical protein
MHQPCKNCPFRKDLPIPFPLGAARRLGIANGILNDGSFPCHKTTVSDYEGNRVWNSDERQCIGAARFIESVLGDCRANIMIRLDVREGWLDPDQLDRSVPVYESVKEFVNAEGEADLDLTRRRRARR